MDVGYLPDMFGHVAQMPQLLRQFGFEHAVVWRGVPSAIDRSGFWWEAPDGSTVRAEYLPEGYGNGALLPDDAKELVAPHRRVRAASRATCSTGPILWMNGTDHLMPQPWLGRVVAEANALDDDYELRHPLAGRARAPARPPRACPRWTGELRSGARANLLMGVGSNRVDVKQAAAVAERALERLAEPLAALFLPAERWPGRLLDVAWLEVIRNSAHDSICACSVDEVSTPSLHRYAEATPDRRGPRRPRRGVASADSLADDRRRWSSTRPPAPGVASSSWICRARGPAGRAASSCRSGRPSEVLRRIARRPMPSLVVELEIVLHPAPDRARAGRRRRPGRGPAPDGRRD